VLCAGYGVFFDSINVLNFDLNQFGYSRSTNAVITTDSQRTWNFPANHNPATGFSPPGTIRKHRLLRAFPQSIGGNGLRNTFDNGYYTRTDSIEISFEKRFSADWTFTASYTGHRIREADFLYNEFDAEPTERISNDGRPHRFIMTGIWELPFGKGKKLASGGNRLLDQIVGGWQLGSTFEWQPGPLVHWSNTRFYYGSDFSEIAKVEERTFERWFNTDNFERNASRGATAFHRGVFPVRIDGIRRDHTLQWNASLAKDFRFNERVSFQMRIDALNVLNRSQMNAPATGPFSTNFGRIVSQTSATNRWLQVQARLTF
jgi:hypothetical protein